MRHTSWLAFYGVSVSESIFRKQSVPSLWPAFPGENGYFFSFCCRCSTDFSPEDAAWFPIDPDPFRFCPDTRQKPFRLTRKRKTDSVLDLASKLPVHLYLKLWVRETAHSLPARETVEDWFSLGWNYLNNNVKDLRLVLLSLEPGRQDNIIASFYSASG